MRILLTNDDGIAAPGLAALYRAIADLSEVHVIAPAEVQSAMSHAVTFHRPIATRKRTILDEAGGPIFEGIAVAGRPADCVKLALHDLMPEPPDLVVSGMNAGANVGINTFYSGTVAAAREAGIYGLPAVAVSLHIGRRDAIRWQDAADHARRALDQALAHGIAPGTMLNINVPKLDDAEPRGLRVVPLSPSRIVEQYDRTDTPEGERHYAASDIFDFHEHHADTDVDALFQGYVTLTPLVCDLTCRQTLDAWSRKLELH
jgi:5'-nucleotidase